MNQLSIVFDKVLETFDGVLVVLTQRHLGHALRYLTDSQLFLLLQQWVVGKRQMGQCSIALDNFQEPQHDSGHHARPAEVQFPQVAAVSGSSFEIVYHSFE